MPASTTAPQRPARRRTNASAAARRASRILDAAVDCLIEEGYANLTTRRVAERAGVAQSTQMHHFPTREAFLVEALGHVARRMAAEALDQLDLTGVRESQRREAILDQTWAAFTSPVAEAATQLWVAAYTEPKLAEALRQFEEDLTAIIAGTAVTLFGERADDPQFAVYVEATLALVRGLAFTAPVTGREEPQRRWEAVKPLVLETAARVLDR